MKIAIIADVLDRNVAGISQYTRHLIMELKKRHELTVIHLRKSNDAVYQGTREIIVPRFFHSRGMLRLYVNIFMRNLNVDIIHHPSTLGAFIFPMRQKTVQTVFDVIPLKLPETRTLVNRLLYRAFMKPSLKNADAIITISNNSKQDICSILRIPENKVHVTPLASSYTVPLKAETVHVKNEYNVSYPYFLCVGTFEPRKNLERLLDAYVLSGVPQHLILVGSRGWKDTALFNKIARMKNVHVLSNVPNEHMPSLYAGATALVFVSLYEGFGLPVIEAMSCGCLVIASCTSSIPEVGGNSVLYVNPYHIKCISRAMRAAVKMRMELAKKGLRQAKKFSWEKTSLLTEKVYQMLLQRKK